MLIPVLIVSLLVHLYSVGYMGEDPHVQRFFSYISLFTGLMLILVTADNFLVMFVGLITYWPHACINMYGIM
jgi:NADH-ubiquinone oxidoreductase chain 5